MSLAIPVQFTRGEFRLEGQEQARERTDDRFALSDIFFAVQAGWRGGPIHFASGMRAFAPTGRFERGNLAPTSANYWTVTPYLNASFPWEEHGMDFSVALGFDFNTENPATRYTSGVLFHGDAIVTKTFECGFGMGVLFGSQVQLSDDSGLLAERFDGFKGHAVSLGPLLKYRAMAGEKQAIDLNLS